MESQPQPPPERNSAIAHVVVLATLALLVSHG
jgi:hypothetical protein